MWTGVYGFIALFINFVIPLVANVIFSDDATSEWWYLTLGLTCLLTMVLQVAALGVLMNMPTLFGMRLAQALVLKSILLFIPMTFVLVAPKLKNDDEFDYMSINMWVVFMFFEFLYVFGYFFSLFHNHIYHLRRDLLPPQSFGVILLLASALWPIFTYWGARSARRIGPWISFYDDQQRLLGLMRSWAWMGALAGTIYNS